MDLGRRIGAVRQGGFHGGGEVVDLEVVLLVEHVVDRGEAEILVHPPVAGDVVVAQGLHHRLADQGLIGAGHDPHHQLAAGRIGGILRHDDQQAVEVDPLEQVRPVAEHVEVRGGVDQVGDRQVVQHQGLARAVVVVDVRVGEVGSPEAGVQRVVHFQAQLCQGRQGLVGGDAVPAGPVLLQAVAVEQAHARDVGPRMVGILDPLAQQGGDRRVRAIGLALVDERRGVVGVGRIAVGVEAVHRGPRQTHGVAGGAGVERIIRRQGDGDRVALAGGRIGVAALVDEVQAVVEELAEQHEPAAVGRIARAGVLIAHEGRGIIAVDVSGDARGVQGRLRGDGLADHPRGVVDDVVHHDRAARALGDGVVGLGRDRGRSEVMKAGVQGARERMLGRVRFSGGRQVLAEVAAVSVRQGAQEVIGRLAEVLLAGVDVVEQPADVAQAVRVDRVGIGVGRGGAVRQGHREGDGAGGGIDADRSGERGARGVQSRRDRVAQCVQRLEVDLFGDEVRIAQGQVE